MQPFASDTESALTNASGKVADLHRVSGHCLYWIASWIAVIVTAAGIVAWLYCNRPNSDLLGLVIVV